MKEAIAYHIATANYLDGVTKLLETLNGKKQRVIEFIKVDKLSYLSVPMKLKGNAKMTYIFNHQRESEELKYWIKNVDNILGPEIYVM